VSEVRWEIQRRFPEARFETEAYIRLGRISLGLVRGIVRMVPGEVEGQKILNEIHRIEVATYKVRSLPDLDRIAGKTRFESQLARAGWTTALRVRDEDSRTWMFVRGNEDGTMRSLFLVAMDGDELTLVSVDGRLDRVVAEAMADHPKEAVRQVQGEGES
jgi:squalene cyclase